MLLILQMAIKEKICHLQFEAEVAWFAQNYILYDAQTKKNVTDIFCVRIPIFNARSH